MTTLVRSKPGTSGSILANRQDQTALLAELARHGHNGGVILDSAWTALRHATHIGIGAARSLIVKDAERQTLNDRRGMTRDDE